MLHHNTADYSHITQPIQIHSTEKHQETLKHYIVSLSLHLTSYYTALLITSLYTRLKLRQALGLAPNTEGETLDPASQSMSVEDILNQVQYRDFQALHIN